MITLDYSPFSNNEDDYFKSLNKTTKYNKIEVTNAIFDEMLIDEDTAIPCTPDRKSWGFDTVLLALFNGTLEAGNLGLQGIPINQLKIRRRRKDSLVFEDVKIFEFDVEQQNYEFKDKFVESIENYVYGIQPMGGSVQNPILGETTTNEVYCEFESTWLIGKNNQYKLMYNLEVGDYETIVPTEVIETLGGQYPIISSNGNLKYRRGSVKCLLLSDDTLNKGNISKIEEKKLRKAILDFLTDRKPKVYKDGSGENMLISITGNPVLTPNNNLNQLIYDLSISFVEVGDVNTQSLINNGLLVL